MKIEEHEGYEQYEKIEIDRRYDMFDEYKKP